MAGTDEDYLRLVRGEGDVRESDGPGRQMLHCARLCFPDPAGPGSLCVEAPLPADFVAELGHPDLRPTRKGETG